MSAIDIPTLIDTFASVDKDMRLMLLLDFSDRMPDLPEIYRAESEAGLHRVPECQTPVYLRMEREGETFRIFADVPRESPTIRGFVSAMIETLDNKPLDEAAAVPVDLTVRMKLPEALSMLRVRGVEGIVQRIRRRAAELKAQV